MTVTIFTGKKKPMIAIGKNQCNLLEFAYKYPGWHSFKQNRATINAVKRLENKGYIEVINDQFKLKLSIDTVTTK